MSQSLHIRGATVWRSDDNFPELETGVQRDLYINKGRVVAERPADALTINLDGYTLFPGLVNAHDHLELNHYPRTKFREVYDNAHQWGEDVNAHLNDEPFKTLRAYPLWDRLFIGGIKNLLCGATTVIHHGAKYREMLRRDFPVRVLRNYGWAHSLHFSSDDEIIESYQAMAKNVPWFIHLAEGTDDVAAGEYQHLKELGCVGINTVIVHGVGLCDESIVDVGQRIRGLVTCPTTNRYLLGRTMDVEKARSAGVTVWLGSDSRLTADGDLLDELAHGDLSLIAWELVGISLYENGTPADWIVLKDDELVGKRRSDLGLVMRDGVPQIGDPEVMAQFPHVETVACTLDGVEKRMAVPLARQVHRCRLKEAGLEVDALPRRKRFWFF